jgi:hypothetical protein
MASGRIRLSAGKWITAIVGSRTLQDYDLPHVKTQDGVLMSPDTGRRAWFEDPDGNMSACGLAWALGWRTTEFFTRDGDVNQETSRTTRSTPGARCAAGTSA